MLEHSSKLTTLQSSAHVGQMDDNDKSFDFCSEEFDPLKALSNSTDSLVPVQDAPVFDNLSQFVSVVRARGQHNKLQDKSESNKLSQVKHGQPGPSRRFLPHQEPVMGRGRSRPLHNILTRMEEATQGPMAALRNCMVNKTRVKVWIRGPAWIRGYCTGYIAAFDKQWNLALTDVDETFTRTRHRKTPIYGSVDHITCRLETMTTGSENTGETIKVESEDDAAKEDDPPPLPPGEEETSVSARSIGYQTRQTETDEPAAAAAAAAADCCSSRAAKMRTDRRMGSRTQVSSQSSSSSVTSEAVEEKKFDERHVTGTSRQMHHRQPANSLTGLVITKLHRGKQTCQRHVRQLFVRGEQIALISLLDI